MSDSQWSLGGSDDAQDRVGAEKPNDTSDASLPPGNRPAQGAARAENTNQLDTGWQGGAGATDFLGLEPDLRGSSAFPSPNQGGAAYSPAQSGNAGESWLLAVEDASQSNATNFHASPMSRSSNDAANPNFDIATQAENAFDEAVTPADDTDPNVDEVVPREALTPKRSSLPRWIAIAASVCALAFGGWYFQRARSTHRTPIDVTVATKPDSKSTAGSKNPPKNAAPKPTPKTPAKPDVAQVPTTTPDTTAQNGDPSQPIETTPDIATTLAANDPDSTTAVAPDPALIAALDRVPSTNTEPDLVATNPSADANDDGLRTATNRTNTTQIALRGLPVLPAFEGPLPSHRIPTTNSSKLVATTATPPGAARKATNEDFANLWREPTIPSTEIIAGEKRLRTINVGRVRALLQDGEYFEGALYAVGEGRIWLELDLGRISFESSAISELVPVRGGSQRVGKANPNGDLAGLPHVEVRLPGGILTGRLVARVDDRITLVTDGGLRLVVESDDVRPVSQTNTRVVGTVEGAQRAEEKPVNTLEKMGTGAKKSKAPTTAAKPVPKKPAPKKP